VDDQGGAVVPKGGQFREWVAHRGGEARRFDIFHPPIGVELLNLQ